MIETITYWIHAAITVTLVVNLIYNEIRLEEMQARMDKWLEEELERKKKQ